MNIREATIADAESIAQVHVASWQTTYRGLIPDGYLEQLQQNIPSRIERWRQILTDVSPGTINYIAEDNVSGIVGFISGGPVRSKQERYTAELYAIYLLENYQKRGIGRSLFVNAVEYFLQNDHTGLLVWVLKDNPAEKFYAAMGGQPALEKQEEIGGAMLTEIGYVWDDLSTLRSQGDLKQ